MTTKQTLTPRSEKLGPYYTLEQRTMRREVLEKAGSIFSPIDQCGTDNLPCGICDECVKYGVLDY